MIKLATDFKLTLDPRSEFSGITSMSHLFALEDGRALAFGWGLRENAAPGAPREYWMAELSRAGATFRALPPSLTHAPERLRVPPDPRHYLQAFAFGGGMGLLLSSDALLLFADVHAEAQWVPIENHIGGLGVLAHPTHRAESHYRPVHCGSGQGDCVPVVFASPTDRDAGRHLALLQIDAAQGRARWLHTAVDGGPRTARLDEYAPLNRGTLAPGGLRLNEQNTFARDLPPVVGDCAWAGSHWLLYATGFNSNPVRFGIPLGVLTRNGADLTLFDVLLQPEEPSFGKICSSLDRLVATPLRANGPRKGRQSVFMFGDKEERPVTPPRGHAGWQVLDHAGKHTWMAPRALNANHAPFELVACRAG